MTIERIISGGQSGADQAGWRAAKRFGLPTGGWMPRGYLTEDGPRPEFARLYGARERKSGSYRMRTLANIDMADATWIFAVDPESSGSKLTATAAFQAGKPSVVIVAKLNMSIPPIRPRNAAQWLRERGIKSLNVAGNRESKAPGIGAWTETYLVSVFRELGFVEAKEGHGSHD